LLIIIFYIIINIIIIITNMFSTDVRYGKASFNIQVINEDSDRCDVFSKTLVDFCCIHNVNISNGRLEDKHSGQFTCLTHTGASVVDYHFLGKFSYIFSYFTGHDWG